MSSRRRSLRWPLAVALLVVGLAAAAPAPPAAPPPAAPPPPPPAGPAIARSLEVPDGALVASGAAPEVDLLYTGDVIGYVEPCG